MPSEFSTQKAQHYAARRVDQLRNDLHIIQPLDFLLVPLIAFLFHLLSRFSILQAEMYHGFCI